MDIDDRQLGTDLFNGVWTLLEASERTRQDDDRMLHMAHASRYHWGQVGSAVLGRAEPCLHHAQRALDLCTESGIDDWDLAFADEAIARGHAVAGDADAARRHTEQALAVVIAEDDDRANLLADLETIPGQQRFW